ncbi:hypothetical protein BLAT2472_10169 [Burkholderia latens]
MIVDGDIAFFVQEHGTDSYGSRNANKRDAGVLLGVLCIARALKSLPNKAERLE